LFQGTPWWLVSVFAALAVIAVMVVLRPDESSPATRPLAATAETNPSTTAPAVPPTAAPEPTPPTLAGADTPDASPPISVPPPAVAVGGISAGDSGTMPSPSSSVPVSPPTLPASAVGTAAAVQLTSVPGGSILPETR
jgi:hypothetical protein